jgi:EmrB/QacA subfamily drug resistance transporter
MVNKRGTLAVVCLATAMLMLDIAVVNTALPKIAHDLHSGLIGVQWIVDAYTLALATVVLTAGALADRVGRRRVFGTGMALFTLASLGCALAQDITVLDVARAVQGLAAALLFASSLAVLADAFSDEGERAKAFAAYGATIGASFALGPLVGGALTSGIDWRAVFFVNLPLGVAGLVFTSLWVRESRDSVVRRVDWAGQVTFGAGLFLLVLALLRGNSDGWGSGAILAELIGGAALLAAALAIESRVREPMLPLTFFRRRPFAAAQVAAFAISASFFALFLYSTLYLQEIVHLSPIETGLAYIPSTFLIFVVSALSAQFASKVAPAVLVAAGLALVAIGLAVMLIADEHSTWLALQPGLLLAGLGTGLVNPSLASLAIGALEADQSGLAAGVNDAFRQTGIAVGVAVFGALVPAGAALGGGSAASYVGGFHHALLLGTGIVGVGAIATAALAGAFRPADVAATAEPVPEAG